MRGVLACRREYQGRSLTVLLNLTPNVVTCDWSGTPLFSTLGGDPEPGMLYSDDGLIIA